MVARYRKEDVSCAIYAINDMLVQMLGVPKKYRGTKNEHRGYFSILYKWIRKERYSIEYVYFVINRVYQKFLKGGKKVNYGYVYRCLEVGTKYYDPNKHCLPNGGNRESMLKAGFTIDFLPFHLLTKEEKAARKEMELNTKFEVTEKDKRELKDLLDKIGANC